MASEIRVNTINNRSGLGTISITNSGAVFSGVTTFAQIKTTSGEVTVGTGASVFSPATNVLALGTNNTEKLRITSSGYVGIGTDNPQRILVVSDNGTEGLEFYPGDSVNGSTINAYNRATSGFTPFSLNALDYRFSPNGGSEALRITSSGNVGIGTDNPGVAGVDILANSAAIRCRESGGSDARLVSGGSISYFGTYSNHDLQFLTNGSQTLRITKEGNIGIGLTNPDLKLHVNGTNALPSSSGSTPTGHLTLRNKQGGATHGMFMGVSNAAPYSSWIQAQDANTNSTNYPLLLNPNGGNVGIGTDNPVGSLEVRDSKANLIVAKDGLTVKSNSDLHTSYDTLQIGAGGALLSYSVATATADTQFVHNAYRSSGGTFKYRYADSAARIRMNSPQGAIIFDNAASGSANADITFTEAARFNSSGNLAFPSGQGIDFSATADGSGTASSEILDDYEEGTWTPTIRSYPNTITYSGGVATHFTYTKIGNQVTVYFILDGQTTSGTTGGAMRVDGLPYAPAVGTNWRTVGPPMFFYSSGLRANDWPVFPHLSQGSSTVQFYYKGSATSNYVETTVANVGTGSYVFFQVTYQVN